MEENKDNPNLANMLSADLPDFSLVKESPSGHEEDSKDKTDKEKLDDIERELANESGNESDETQAPGQISDNEVNTFFLLYPFLLICIHSFYNNLRTNSHNFQGYSQNIFFSANVSLKLLITTFC